MPEPDFGGSYLLVCAVYDEKVKAFLRPVFYKTRGEAVRQFGDAVRSNESEFFKHPEDYSFHVLGKYFEEAGRFENMEPAPEMLVLALSMTGDDSVQAAAAGGRADVVGRR